MSTSRSVVVLGGSGFIGSAVVSAAVAAGFGVTALARSSASAEVVAGLGAVPLRGDVSAPGAWMASCAGADALIDLTQPELPSRLTTRSIGRLAEQRLAATRSMLTELGRIPADARPLWLSVNGTDDLLPDESGQLSSRSALRSTPQGFAHIGLPVRAAIQASGMQACYVYFGQMVYGPGKAYAGFVVDGVRTGKAKIIGSGANHLPLTHVDDAAASIVHLLTLDRAAVLDRTVVAVPATPATQRELFARTADALGRPVPGRVPTIVAALVAGGVNADIMTLDARCNPDLLTTTGFTFRHETLATGVTASLAAMPTTT